MAWPVESNQIVDSTWYLKWQTETEMRFKAKRKDTLQWVVLFMIRSAIYLYCLFHIFSFVKRKVPRFIGFGPVRRNPNLRKFRRLVIYYSLLLVSHRYGAYDLTWCCLRQHVEL